MKKHYTLFLVLLTFLHFSLSAQTVWKTIDTKITNAPAMTIDLEAVNNQVAWGLLCAGDFSTSPWSFEYSAHHIFKTTDGGKTVTLDSFPSLGIGFASNISPISDKEAWVSFVDFAEGNKVLHTTNGGKNWKAQNINIPTWVNFVHFWDVTSGLAMGDPDLTGFYLYTTNNNGDLWQQVKNTPAPLPGEAGLSNEFVVDGTNVWFTTSQGRIFHSKNKGYTWAVIDSKQPFVEHLCAKADGHLLAIINDYSDTLTHNHKCLMQRSNDMGKTWENATPALNDFGVIAAQYIAGSSYLIAEARKNNATGPFRTLLSKDHGKSWQTIDEGTKTGFIDFTSPISGWASEYKNDKASIKLFQYDGSALVGLLQDTPLDANVSLSPSLVQSTTHLKLQSEKSNDYLILINDLSGKLLFKRIISNTQNLDEVLDLQVFSAGMYVVTVSSKDGNWTGKVVKE
jgi:photosystem II stability/assembly factor-like uncharacterized protein